MADINDILGASSDADAKAKTQALVQALRGQQALGGVFALTGDKAIGGLGNQLMEDAGSQRALAFKADEARRQNAMEQQKLGLERLKTNLMFGPGSISPAALDNLVRRYIQTGELPPGNGPAALALRSHVMNRAAEMSKESGGTGQIDLAANRASYKADSHSLETMQKQADTLDSFEKTALANLDIFLDKARKVVDPGSPLFNAPARAFAEKVAGDPRMSEFTTSRQVAVQELSKLLSGAQGGVVSDSARHEASSLISPDASLAQIEAAAKILKQDAANRKASVHGSLAEIRARMNGGAAPKAEAAPAAAPAAAATPAATADLRKKYGL